MKKSRLFIENMVVYGFGQVIAKIIPFIMLPIVTRLMPDSYYMGINDMNVLIVSFGSQIAIMGLYDAMFRLYFDKNDKIYQKKVCSTALTNCFLISVLIFVVLIFFRSVFSELIFNDRNLSFLLILSALNIMSDALKGIVSAPTRIKNKRKVFLVVNTVTPVISYCISVPMLMNGNFLYALPIASLASSFTMLIIFFLLNRNFFDIQQVSIRILKQLYKIGIPLMPTFLIYWIFSSFDRIMIMQLIGASAAGIYAVGNKVSMISQLVYQAFAGGWSYFSFSTMNDDDQVKTNTRIFTYLATISFAFYALMVLFSDMIFHMLFTGDYVEASIIFPYLFLSPLLLMLFQIIGNQFIIIKKSYLVTLSLIIGAVLNIILNYILIPVYEIEGAAIATVIGYLVSTILAIVIAKKYKLYISSRKFNVLLIGLLILLSLSALHVYILRNIFCLIYLLMIAMLFYSDLRKIIKNVRKK